MSKFEVWRLNSFEFISGGAAQWYHKTELKQIVSMGVLFQKSYLIWGGFTHSENELL